MLIDHRHRLWLAGAFAALPFAALPQPAPAPPPAAGAAKAAPAAAKAAPVPAPLPPALPVVPAPAATAEEAQFVARMDKAIAPARDYSSTLEDAMRIRDAIAAFSANDQAKGRPLASQIADPVGRKLVDWFRLRSGIGEPTEYRAFIDQNPAWPDPKLMTQRFEEALFSQGGSAQSIKAYFKASEPQTGIGRAALASALLAEGNEAAAAELARIAWRGRDIPATFEAGFLDRFGPFLGEADHKWRLDRLLVEDVRWTQDRTERAAFARRLIPKLSALEQQKAEARLAVFLKSPLGLQLLDALPPPAEGAAPDWGLAYHRIQALRRAGREEEAARLMLAAPIDPEKVANLDEWWEERRVLAYAALKSGKARLAYDLVKAAGPIGVNALKEQQLLAGWLALRQLNDAKTAANHFAAMRKAADGPLSLGKAEYWLARTAEALGDQAKAAVHFKAGAQYKDTFFGQLSRQRLGPEARRLDIGPPAPPTEAEISAFNSLDAVKAAVLARKSGLESAVVRAFLMQLYRVARTEGEAAMVTHLTEALGDTQLSVRIGKLGIGRGFNLYSAAYPLHPMPTYQPLRAPPETALLLSIARQESEFNPKTVSGAGARGILQVMPVTAKHVCRDYKLKCEIDRLLTDSSYNATIASAYITDRMAEFQGSYVLTFAGYNAGPGRARQWMREFGDPRDPKVDPVDWIMRIPFEETREYVQKVMSNVQVYRARLGDRAGLRIAEDLARARSAARATDPAPGAPPAEAVAPKSADAGTQPFPSAREP